MKLKKGFTLAEALIAMAVIGVVAMLTVPVIKGNSDEKIYVASVKKAYNVLTSATNILETEHGPCELWNWTNAMTWYQEIMNGTPASGTYDVEGNGSVSGFTMGSGSGYFSTSDGMLWYQVYTRVIAVDTNGMQGPNIMGVDVHHFDVGETVTPHFGYTKTIIETGEMSL